MVQLVQVVQSVQFWNFSVVQSVVYSAGSLGSVAQFARIGSVGSVVSVTNTEHGFSLANELNWTSLAPNWAKPLSSVGSVDLPSLRDEPMFVPFAGFGHSNCWSGWCWWTDQLVGWFSWVQVSPAEPPEPTACSVGLAQSGTSLFNEMFTTRPTAHWTCLVSQRTELEWHFYSVRSKLNRTNWFEHV